MLPNFLIIGAAKAGTTSLYHYVRQHPDVYMSAIKEPNYFCFEEQLPEYAPVQTLAEYESLFDGVSSQLAVGEASTQYLNSAAAPERIANILPNVKLIVSLRNSADRAYSSYLGRVWGGRERASVSEALHPGSYFVESSFYYPPLSRYFSRFARSQIKTIVFDDLVANPKAVMSELFEFLQVDPTFEVQMTARHAAGAVPRSIGLNELLLRSARVARNILPHSLHGTGLAARIQRLLRRPPEPLPAGIRRELLEYFRNDIEQTEALVHKNLSRWLE